MLEVPTKEVGQAASSRSPTDPRCSSRRRTSLGKLSFEFAVSDRLAQRDEHLRTLLHDSEVDELRRVANSSPARPQIRLRSCTFVVAPSGSFVALQVCVAQVCNAACVVCLCPEIEARRGCLKFPVTWAERCCQERIFLVAFRNGCWEAASALGFEPASRTIRRSDVYEPVSATPSYRPGTAVASYSRGVFCSADRASGFAPAFQPMPDSPGYRSPLVGYRLDRSGRSNERNGTVSFSTFPDESCLVRVDEEAPRAGNRLVPVTLEGGCSHSRGFTCN